tara:strand:+ start:637 stop:1011 length:375 start_codon:yes stop_codon:yes gene_type:complete
MSGAASSLLEKARPILALYRQILRTHVAALPEPMKTLGDKYVQSEFRQHLRSTQTTKEHWREFHVQWTTYLSQIRGDAGGVSGELDPEILANLPEDKKEQLRRLQEETSKPFSMEAKVEKEPEK